MINTCKIQFPPRCYKLKLLLKKMAGDKDAEKQETKLPPVPFLTTFYFAKGYDKLFMFLGSVGSVGQGIAMPLMTVVFGEIIDVFTRFARGLDDRATFDRNITTQVVNFW